MIGQLRGRLTDKRPHQVLVDVGGEVDDVGDAQFLQLLDIAPLGDPASKARRFVTKTAFTAW